MTAPASPRGARDTPRETVFGVLGGIASGKSKVATLLAGEGGVVLCADEHVRAALGLPEIQERLVAAFGPEAVGADGRTDRGVLAARVFASDAERRKLEGWIHPIVRARILSDLAEARERGVGRIVLDVPLLLENENQHGFASLCDHLVFVDASAEVRDRRAVEHRGWNPGEVSRREAAQMPLEDKMKRAHYVVRNEGTTDQLERAVREVLADVGLA